MRTTLFATSVITGVILFFFILFNVLGWTYHLSKTKERNRVYGYGTFEKFKYEFESRPFVKGHYGDYEVIGKDGIWETSEVWESSGEIHFDHKGMCLPFIDYLQFRWYMYELRHKSNTVKW